MTDKKATESYLRPEIFRELNKIRLNKEQADKTKRRNWPKEEKSFEHHLKTKVREVVGKIMKDQDYDKMRKADKKLGGVRGKFHPSLERTRKRT
jgi:hypothetical protein